MAATAVANPGLLKCPKNLKECIDWIVCIKSHNKTSGLAKAVEKVLGNSKGDVNDLITKLSEGLQNFLEGIKNNGGSSYVSSYVSNATWPDCGSGQQCPGCSQNSSPPCPCKSSGPCPSSQCCENCDVKKAAKIFLGFLPCMWYALDYLYKQCEKDKSEGGWSGENINNKDHSPGRFLIGMGYELGKLQSKTGQDTFSLLKTLFNGSDGPLEKLYNVSKNYFISRFTSPDPSSTPKSVREILLWLSGLPFTPGFEALLKHCKDLCKTTGTSKNSVNPEKFETSLYSSCFLSPFVLGAIQHSDKSKSFLPSTSDWTSFCYPEDPFDLLNMLFENVRKVFVPLKFLCLQCERKADLGGWGNCRYGKDCAEKFQGKSLPSGFTSSSSSGSCTSCPNSNTYLCTYSSSNPDVHDGHCHTGQCIGSDSGSCNGGGHNKGKTCNPCSHPLLRFLLDGSEDLQNFPTPFKSPEGFPKMGFSKDQLPATGWSGYESLLGILSIFVGKAESDKKVCFLRNLLRFLLCLTRAPPDTLGELFSFFYRLAEWFNPEGTDPRKDQKENFKTSLLDEISSHPGTYSGQKLTTAVYDVYGSDHQNHSNTPYSLRLLSHCWKADPKPCGNFLCPLVLDALDLFVNDFVDTYLSFICHLAKDFRKTFEELKGKFSKCCSSSNCKIVECPCAHPIFYSHGLTFMSPGNLNCVDGNGKEHQRPSPHGETDPQCTRRTCKNFITQLEKVVDSQSPLQKLLDAIDEFLWSIREPFFLFVLAFWALVISYFLYVQLYKLDLLRLISHAHFSRSFKILPSTLFSDASSRLKDLSYFSL